MRQPQVPVKSLWTASVFSERQRRSPVCTRAHESWNVVSRDSSSSANYNSRAAHAAGSVVKCLQRMFHSIHWQKQSALHQAAEGARAQRRQVRSSPPPRSPYFNQTFTNSSQSYVLCRIIAEQREFVCQKDTLIRFDRRPEVDCFYTQHLSIYIIHDATCFMTFNW